MGAAAHPKRLRSHTHLEEVTKKISSVDWKPKLRPCLFPCSLAEIFEREKDIYQRKDPDPLDTRHPYRADPSCQYGLLLKLLARKDTFMNKVRGKA